MRKDHKETWKAHREELKIHVGQMSLVAPNELQLPVGISDAIEGIAVKDGWICGWEECTVAGVSRDWVVKHCVNAHGKEAAREKKVYEGRIQSLLWHPYIKSAPTCLILY
jgi:hypothetical protein